MSSRTAITFCVLAVLAVPVAAGIASGTPAVDAVAGAAGTHGGHVTVGNQGVSDGTVVVETLSIAAPGFVVLWTDDDGRPGDPVGHAAVPADQFRTDVPVPVDADIWETWTGNRTLRAVVHRDDGDGTFDPDDDPSIARREPAAEIAFELGRTDRGADRVLAQVDGSQTLDEGRLTVRRVDLSAAGFVVAKSVGGDRVVGTRTLPAGHHENVTVGLNESFLAEQRQRFRVRLVAYRDDGDAEFGESDRPVTVGGQPVASSLLVEKPDGIATTTASVAGTATDAPTGTTAAPTPSDTPSPRPGTAAGTDDTPTGEGTSANGPGFGVVTVLLAGILTLLAVAAAVDGFTRDDR